MWAMGEPSGPMLKGMTYMVRPRMQPVEQAAQAFAFISLGCTQLLVGPASSLLRLQMKVRSSTRATSLGIGAGQEAVGALLRVEADEGARLDHLLAKAVVFLLRAVAPVHSLRLAERDHLLDPRAQLRNCSHSRGLPVCPACCEGLTALSCCSSRG